MRKMTWLLATATILFSIFPASAGNAILRLATTTSTYETGLLDYILPPFEKAQGVKIQTISCGTGKAIKIAENGDVDIILVHARQAEDKFVADGFGVNRREVMYNDFVILGPEDDPAKIDGLKDAGKALSWISAIKHTFVSRGDESGTHKKEKELWAKAKIVPQGDWYMEVGQGMSATLRIADEKKAYVLVDRASFLAAKDTINLHILIEGDSNLFNPYGIIPVSPYMHAHVNYEKAMALVAWITSPECQKMIANYKKAGQQLFYPDAAEQKK